MGNVAVAHSIETLRDIARRRLPQAIFDYFDGGADDELTLVGNRAAFDSTWIVPRALVDVSSVSLACELVGGAASMPLAIAPTGGIGFGRKGADIDIARAAVAAGIPYTLSSSATASIEQIAEAAPGRLWFQAYMLRDKAWQAHLIARALAADYEALVITVDLPVGGKRERDFRNHLSFPIHFTPRNLFDFAKHPRWAYGLLRHGLPVAENLRGMRPPEPDVARLTPTLGRMCDPSFDWQALQVIRDTWPRTLIVKGILHAADAERVCELGAQAVVVSNHGGRQLDGALPALRALPAVVQAVRGRIPVLVDGGVRRGTDILKARALGAQGVLTGRAALWGAMAHGQDGATHALAILRSELERAMQLSGVREIADITPDLLHRHATDIAANAFTACVPHIE
jgi:(S)-mandelate dehydrogenase